MIQRLESSFTGTLHHSEANNAVAADGHNGDGAVSVGQPSAEVESSLRQKLKEQEELLAEQDQRIRELEAAADEKRSATLQRKKSSLTALGNSEVRGGDDQRARDPQPNGSSDPNAALQGLGGTHIECSASG